MRPLPPIDLSQVKRHRTFVFDYDNGLFTVNGRLMDPNRIDAAIEQGTAEIWTIRNSGHNWAHPIHTHFEEFQILEVNGKPVSRGDVLKSRKDVIRLGPGDEIKFYSHWRDFLGKYVMHCHNVVHEDHAMMIRWDIVPQGQGY
jgi:FtsP/CotA-like multicopper oxidase with cupredoxin domain